MLPAPIHGMLQPAPARMRSPEDSWSYRLSCLSPGDERGLPEAVRSRCLPRPEMVTPPVMRLKNGPVGRPVLKPIHGCRGDCKPVRVTLDAHVAADDFSATEFTEKR